MVRQKGRQKYLKTITGDTDALVTHYAEELPQAYRYVQIGETLRDAGHPDDAITWLRRGVAEADRPDSRIDQLLAELLTATGRHAEAVDTRWKLFTARPDIERYRHLLTAAEPAGTRPQTAERATTHLRELAAHGGAHADPLLTILLAAGEVDAAWTAATQHRCSLGVHFMTASRRAETHPADAIGAYAARVDDLIDRKTKSAYSDAARLLTDLRDLYRRAGTDFAAYLGELTDKHRRKSTFLTELRRAGL